MGFKNRNPKPKKQFMSQQEFKASKPEEQKMSKESAYFAYSGFKALQNTGNIEVHADPNSPASLSGYPYAVINSTNKVLTGNYVGTKNIEGNTLKRLQNSNDSKLLYAYDLVTLNERVNYLYLNYVNDTVDNHNNLAMNLEMHKAFEEALAKGYSTMLTALPFSTDKVVFNGPNPYQAGTAMYSSYNKMMAILHYQTILQNAVAPISKYIQTRSLEQTVMNMSYRREAPLLASLYGLIKKSAFIASLESISTATIGEYFDTEWYRQVNTLMFMASRKTNSISDPLITSTCTTCVPPVTISTGADVEYYNYETDMRVADVTYINPDTFAVVNHASLSFEQLIYLVLRSLDVSTMIHWARKVSNDPTSLPVQMRSASGYYENAINSLVKHINTILSRFSSYMTEIRTFIDKLSDSGMVYWKKGITFKVADIKVFNPDFNTILHDTITAYCGGASDVTYDTTTLRWGVNTLWNKYTGINRFDATSGGSFLTFGLRHLNNDADTTDISYCVPIMFAPAISAGDQYSVASDVTAANFASKVQDPGVYHISGGVYRKVTSSTFDPNDTYYYKSPEVQSPIQVVTINRLGDVRAIVAQDTNIGNNASLSRLDSMNQNLKVKIPTITVTGSTESTNVRAIQQSSLLYLLNNLFGYGKVVYNDVTESVVSSDYVCFLDIEIDDVSNETIQFCRNYSPFRVTTPDGSRSLGFASTTTLGKK